MTKTTTSRRFAPIILALTALLAASAGAAARGWMPDPDHRDHTCFYQPDGTYTCVGSASEEGVTCTGVWQSTPPGPGPYRETFEGVCRSDTDPTNLGVCRGYDEGYEPPEPGQEYSWGYSCTGYWDGCTSWGQSEGGHYGPNGERVWHSRARTVSSGVTGAQCPYRWDEPTTPPPPPA